MDATSILHELGSGSTTAETIIADAIAKIKATHAQLNAATEIMEDDAHGQLQSLVDGPLNGLPVSIKECYAIAGKKITSASKRMTPLDCKEDATVVKKLKAAGAVVVARGNTSEFLLGRETDNLVYGTTNSVFDKELTGGGSSGGDGALVGSGCVPVGIGTDIGGSCRYPAVFNGIVGFKPASGQIDKMGIFPAAGNIFVETMNSPGTLTRSVRDARLIYNVIGDKRLEASSDISGMQLFTSSAFRVKICDESISRALNASVEFFRSANVAVKDIDIPESGAHYPDFGALIMGGFTDKIYEWSTMADGKRLSFFGELFSRMTGNPTLSYEIFALLPAFNLLKPSPAKLEKVINNAQAARDKYYSLLGSKGILILPTVGILAPRHKKFIAQYNKPGVVEIITPVSFCNVYNLSCITLPAWKFQADKGKNPPGIQLVAAPGSEELLLNAAEQLEKHLQK